jgi:hypothetical protein
MRSTTLPFAALRQLLLDLGFEEKTLPSGHAAYYHEASDTLILLRAYQPLDLVSVPDVLAVRSQLDAHGVLGADAFDARLRKASA